ncbi:Trp biosynthesis-associated membrane protein [Nakamurella leprariae]|uniref:Trp biosynthesis-associated membrane protein n=1 Tax=Nakamurella leprariae TaxID=2803911 RepID=A0A938YA71_9ACTN|nr:Trp biosynthesis-associated membrane protein [Nakamurella leprariae]MBM9466832.1 Trp biosynthesis-associated membrane protein [Nakamurella leprariae]
MSDAPDDRPEVEPTARSRRRPVAVLWLSAVLGAALAASAAGLTWWTQSFDDPLQGRIDIAESGGSVVPALIPIALVALAGLAATLGVRGWLRRGLGVLLAAAGGVLTWLSLAALGGPAEGLTDRLARPAAPVGGADVHPVGPLLGAQGGLLIALAAVLVVAGVGARRLGSRYERPARRAGSAARPVPATPEPTGPARGDGADRAGDVADSANPAAPVRSGDTDSLDWWRQLDAGVDPTRSDG